MRERDGEGGRERGSEGEGAGREEWGREGGRDLPSSGCTRCSGVCGERSERTRL